MNKFVKNYESTMFKILNSDYPFGDDYNNNTQSAQLSADMEWEDRSWSIRD